MTQSRPCSITVVLFDGFELLDVFGPAELFGMVPGVTVRYAAPDLQPVASSHGARVLPDLAWAEVDVTSARTDVLLVPGGRGTRSLVHDESALRWIADAGVRADIVSSVCTGSAVLAASGLLDGHRATSNKLAFDWASGFGDDVEWVRRARWVHDRDRWTSSGVAAGMDMSAAMITHLFGVDAAHLATRRAEYEPHPDADRDPFAEPDTGAAAANDAAR